MEAKGENLFSTSHQEEIFSHFLENKVSIHMIVAQEDAFITGVFSSSFPPQLYLLNMTSYCMEYPFHQFKSAVLAVSTPHCLPSPGLLSFGHRGSGSGGDGWRDSFDVVPALLTNSQIIGVI